MLYPLGPMPIDCNDSRGFPHKDFALLARIFDEARVFDELFARRAGRRAERPGRFPFLPARCELRRLDAAVEMAETDN